MLDGHVSYEEYFALLSRSKITQNFCRHPGAMLTRALESLSMGSIALVQEGSVHNIWGGPDTGVFTFHDGRLGEAVVEILADYERHSRACYEHAEQVRRQFAPATVASRFFRYATVLATGVPRSRDVALDGLLAQRRHVFLIGPRPSVSEAARQCEESLDFEYPGFAPAERLNLRARELALLHCQALHEGKTPPDGPLGIAVAIADLRRATQLEPDALAVRFNLVRLLMHLGGPAGIPEAVSLAEATVAAPEQRWRLAAGDDVYPWDFFGEWFDSRSYLDTASATMGGAGLQARLTRLVYAALHNYIAVQRDSVEHARLAVSMNGDFPYYALRLSQLLARTGAPSDAREAADLLLGLTERSEIAARALCQLEALAEVHPELGDLLGAPEAAVAAARAAVVIVQHGLTSLRSEYLTRTLLRRGGFGAVVHHQARPDAPRPRVSVLVCGQAARGCRPLLTALANQSAPRGSYEVVYVECFEYLPDEASLADTAISCAQNGFQEHRLEALARALEQARGEIVVVVEPGSNVGPAFVERLLSSYYVTGDALAVQAVTIGGWLDKQPACRYVAFPLAPARLTGGFDVHAVFAGRNGTPLELAFRLQQFGLPVVAGSGGAGTIRRLPPWWHLRPFSADDAGLSACALLYPHLLDPSRVDAMMSWRQVHAGEPDDSPRVVERGDGFNILRYHGQYVGLRQSLGAVDLREGLLSVARRYGSGNVVVSDDLAAVRRGVITRSALSPGSTGAAGSGPRLVQTVGEFNIVHVGGIYVGLRHAIGAVEFRPDHDLSELQRVFGGDNVVLSITLEGARAEILSLSPARSVV
jgi:hypothetical protein